MSLQQKLDETTAYFNANLPPEASKIFLDTLEAGISNHITENALSEGDYVEDFTLPSSTGETFNLSNKLVKGPVVLFFYRGSWCPYCNLTLKAYQDILDKIQGQNASLVAVTPEFPHKAQETRTKEGLAFDVITDEHNQLAGKFGLIFDQKNITTELLKTIGFDFEDFYGPDHENLLPIPGTFIIDTNGKVAFSYVNPNYRERLEPVELVDALMDLN
ncbi:MAG: peroxiredoxin-like family protein [Bacteroidota bacterium]